MLPQVTITKNVFSTVGAPPSSIGILAIAACSSTGTLLQPGGYARSDLGQAAFGYGPLPELMAYTIDVANNPVVAIKGNASFPGAYELFSTSSMTGTSLVTTSSAAGNPFDTFDSVTITFTVGGTVGVSGIVYTYSLDGGVTQTPGNALGVNTTLTIPNTGIALSLGAGTIATGDIITFNTARPKMGDTDVQAVLTALQQSRLGWEGVLIDSSLSASTVGLVDTILTGWEARGIFRFFLLNTRFKARPEPTAETEAAYAAALQTMTGSQVSIRGCVGADGAHCPSVITGVTQKRPTSMFLGAKAMSFQANFGTDPAYVATGPLTGAQIADGNGNPFDHDEDVFPTLDGLRLVSLRSFAPGGPQGVYITNANTIQPLGGSFPYLQFIRIANEASRRAWAILSTQLSRGVRKNPKADPTTGAVYIFEPDASVIEQLVNDDYVQPFRGQVTAIRFSLSRTDNMAAVPCVVTGKISIVALAYIKGFQIQLEFDKTITVAN